MFTVSSVKHDEFVGVRLPRQLRGAIERERLRMSRAAGAEVKLSAVIRAALEKQFQQRRRRAA